MHSGRQLLSRALCSSETMKAHGPWASIQKPHQRPKIFHCTWGFQSHCIGCLNLLSDLQLPFLSKNKRFAASIIKRNIYFLSVSFLEGMKFTRIQKKAHFTRSYAAIPCCVTQKPSGLNFRVGNN